MFRVLECPYNDDTSSCNNSVEYPCNSDSVKVTVSSIIECANQCTCNSICVTVIYIHEMTVSGGVIDVTRTCGMDISIVTNISIYYY